VLPLKIDQRMREFLVSLLDEAHLCMGCDEEKYGGSSMPHTGADAMVLFTT